jgi:methionyl-tRNA synthetase
MIERHCGGRVPTPASLTEEDLHVFEALSDMLPALREQLAQQNVRGICETVMNVSKLGNRYINNQTPWVLAKTDKTRLNTVLYVLSELLRHTAILIEPVVPVLGERLLDQLGIPPGEHERNFAALSRSITPGLIIGTPRPVFPRLDVPEPVSAATEQQQQQQQHAAAAQEDPALAQFACYDALNEQQLTLRIAEVGNDIRLKKAMKIKKSELTNLILELNYLKNR